MAADDKKTSGGFSIHPAGEHKVSTVRIRKKQTRENTRLRDLRSSVSLSFRPLFAGFCALTLLLYRGFLIRTSHLEFFEQTFDLDFAFKSLDGFFYVIADYSYLYYGLSPVSFLT
jgi:hypothetical protein